MQNPKLHTAFRFVSVCVLVAGLLETTLAHEWRWLHIGKLQTFVTERGAAVELEGPGQNYCNNYFSWPADYGLIQSTVTSNAWWLGCKNFYDAQSGRTLNIKVAGVGPREDPDTANEIFEQEIKMIGKFDHPLVTVDGQLATTNELFDRCDEIDPNLKADRMVIVKFNTALGISVTKKVYAFSQQNHDNYFIYDIVLKNTGIIDRDGTVYAQKLEDFWCYFLYRYAFSGESKLAYNLGWGAWSSVWGVSTLNHDFGGDPTASDFEMRGFYSWYAPNKDRKTVSYAEDWGCPNETDDGIMSSAKYAGCVTLHADQSPDNPRDDLFQPRTTSFIGSDLPITMGSQYGVPVDSAIMAERYNAMSNGHPYQSHAEEVGDRYPQDCIADRGGTSQGQGFGPYTLAPGDSIRIVFAEGVSGISREKNREVSANWLQYFKGTGTPELIMPDGSVSNDHNAYKRAWGETGKDSILKAYRNALANFQSGLNIPQPPPPPDFFHITTKADRIQLTWANNAESWPHFDGYVIYRASGNACTPGTRYEKIFECEASNCVNQFDDLTANNPTVWNYYIQSKDDGSANDREPGKPLYSSLFWTVTNQTVKMDFPSIQVTAGIDTLKDPFSGAVLYFNAIRWSILPENLGEYYNLYYSESDKITDVAAPGVIRISTNLGRSTTNFNHRLYTVDGSAKTVYYAITATYFDQSTQKNTETPIGDGINNSPAITALTSLLYEVPLVESFNFVPDANLNEFEELGKSFTRCQFKPERAGGLHGPEWNANSTDLNFTAYIVMDAEHMYVGGKIIDDNPHGTGTQVIQGDGFDILGGLYDVGEVTSLFRGQNASQNGQGGYRIGSAINASETNRFQILGNQPWSPEWLEYAQFIDDHGYSVEFKIPFAALNEKFGSLLIPENGMRLPFAIEINDNDGPGDDVNSTNNQILRCYFGNTPENLGSSWRLRAETWGAPVIIRSTPLPPLNWVVALTIADSGTQMVRSFGGNLAGSEGYDTGLDVISPPPSQGVYSYFQINSFPNYLLTDIRQWKSPFETELHWMLKIIHPEGGNTALSWDPLSLPDKGNFRLGGAGKIINMRNTDSLSVTGDQNLTITYQSKLIMDYSFSQPGWYLVSLPLIPENSSVATLFPDALEKRAFIWNTQTDKYESVTELEPKHGYWLAIPSASTVQITGAALNEYTIHFPAPGWYMIGSVLGDVDFSAPNDEPDGLVQTPAVTWNPGTESYLQSTTLFEKEGYWVAVLNECDLIVGRTSGLTKKLDSPAWQLFNSKFGTMPPAPPSLTAVAENRSDLPKIYHLSQNYPNPFNPQTRIDFQLPKAGEVEITIYDILGRQVIRLESGYREAGRYSTIWNGKDALGLSPGSGIYFLQMRADHFVATHKLVLLQ